MQPPYQSNQDLELIDVTIDFAFKGARILFEMTNEIVQGETISFQAWSKAITDRKEIKAEFKTSSQLIWLWESLRKAPSFNHLFGELPSATVPWSSKTDRFYVSPPGQLFLIGMNSGEVSHLLVATMFPVTDERVTVLTQEPLRMRPGKHDRLECCDCRSVVTIRVDKTFGIEREADIMRIESNRIVVEGDLIKVHVDSLNQAYTVSSRRLEPKRRSHGGRTYDHMVHVDHGNRQKLETIRFLVEMGRWRPDSLTEQQIESMFVEPEQWGLRGDQYLWRELRQHFIDHGVSKSLEKIDSELSTLFENLVGVAPTSGKDSVFVARYEQSGISGGQVSPQWWRETGFPLIQKRFEQTLQPKSARESQDIDESQ